MGHGGKWDESSFTDRPSRRGSRPRTKNRPTHDDATLAMVIGVDRGRYTLVADDGLPAERRVVAMRARELGRTRIVCADRVAIVGDTSGAAGTLARIVRVEDRKTVLRRTADDTDPYERIIVANADQLVIVTACADPTPRPRMIDRCIVAAFDAGMDVLLCMTKADLADPEPIIAPYRDIGVESIITRRADGRIEGLPALIELLRGRVSVLVGHSGVGKSTLVNALVPGADRATGHVNAVTGRGRQTSTSAVALRLMDEAHAPAGWVIDTPGVRSFGLAHVGVDSVIAAFDDLTEVVARCPRGCTHLAGAPDCELDAWVATASDGEGIRRSHRVDSLRRLLAARGATTTADRLA
ncbi:ribosome small subunit-dependent GTPase A [Rarobacter incanus]|uniref:Ribosome biogenesis GTPase n=1 Tax=Rarobacter incanus TaxID=153494 RepID=A0A542SNK8_9MICO|nr:ribosome small subunit-dependent GTPase A [Rarobacter incanus]TQK76189.1 ribosome biogenesis GTPase [Rarobacter incanus]